jgi:hypothetical protein
MRKSRTPNDAVPGAATDAAIEQEGRKEWKNTTELLPPFADLPVQWLR